MAKSPRKTSTRKVAPAAEPGRLETPAHGAGKLRRGNPGNKGGGRKPDEFKALCRELASREETVAAAERILRDPDHPAYLGALKWATENGYGKPHQTIETENKHLHQHAVVILPPVKP